MMMMNMEQFQLLHKAKHYSEPKTLDSVMITYLIELTHLVPEIP